MFKEMQTRAKYEKNQVKKTPIPEVRCPKCGKHYHSVLLNLERLICPKCGTKVLNEYNSLTMVTTLTYIVATKWRERCIG